MKKQQKPFWFTLVELIVVISILVILGTVAFVSIGGYMSNARDSKRISNVDIISKGFNVTIATGIPPNTEKTATGYNIAISTGSLSMTGYYGTINDTLLRSLKIMGNDIATYDGYQEYRYSYFPKERKYQILATLENQENSKIALFLPDFITKAFAASTTVGYPFVRGNYTATGGIDNIIVDGATWTTKTPVSGVKTFAVTETINDTDPIPLVPAGVVPMNGVCGTPPATPTAPVTGLCAVGTLTGSITDQGVNLNYTWACDGVNGGSPTAANSCSTVHSPVYCVFDTDPVNGKFGDGGTTYCVFAP